MDETLPTTPNPLGGSDPGDEVDFILDDDAEITIYEAEISPELVIEEAPELVIEPEPEPEIEWTMVSSNGRVVYWAREGETWLLRRSEEGEVRRSGTWDHAQKYLDGNAPWN